MFNDTGDLLLASGLLSEAQLVDARQARSSRGSTVPEFVVYQGILDDEELTELLRRELGLPRVHPNALVGLPQLLIERMPREMAIKNRVLPVASNKDGSLNVVISDPCDREAIALMSNEIGTILPTLATQMQLAWGLAQYYGAVTELGATLIRPKPERKRGLTDQVEARRHAVMVPMANDHDNPHDLVALAQQSGAEMDLARLRARADAPTPAALETRGGEVEVRSARERYTADELPNVMVDQAIASPTPESEPSSVPEPVSAGTESQPILLTRPSRRQRAMFEPNQSVVIVEPRRRQGRETDLGIGSLSAAPPGAQDEEK